MVNIESIAITKLQSFIKIIEITLFDISYISLIKDIFLKQPYNYKYFGLIENGALKKD